MIADSRLAIADSKTMTADQLKARSQDFALRCLKVVEALPRSTTGRTIANQLTRGSTSVAANYRAACRARSRVEFIARIGVVEEEADETTCWLELAVKAGVLSGGKVSDLLSEANELVAIFASSRISAQRRRAENRQSPIANRQ